MINGKSRLARLESEEIGGRDNQDENEHVGLIGSTCLAAIPSICENRSCSDAIVEPDLNLETWKVVATSRSIKPYFLSSLLLRRGRLDGPTPGPIIGGRGGIWQSP